MASKKKKPLSHTLIAGGTAGLVESSICHPLDTIKTRMQLRNNHIESVSTRIRHSLIEPAVLHARHSLMEPALRFKHSLAEASILNQKRAAHSLVEPANIIKLKRHTLQEQSTIQPRGADAGISTVSTSVTKDVSSSKPSPNWWSSRAMASNNSGNVNRGIVTKAKSSSGSRSGEKCWWNQPRQNLVKTAVAKTPNRSFGTEKDVSKAAQSKVTTKATRSNSKATSTTAWWNWHKNSSTTLSSRGHSSKSAAWYQPVNSLNTKRLISNMKTNTCVEQQSRRWHGTYVENVTTSTNRKGPLGPIQTAQRIIRKEGFKSLYKGLSAVYLGIIPKMAIRFVAFEQYKDLLRNYTNLGDKATNFSAGLLSGLTEAVMIVTPAEVCKIRMQSQRHSLLDPFEANSRKYGNVVQTAITIVREEGYSALYKGVVPTMMRQGCNQAVNFTAYNAMKTFWLERQRQQNPRNPAALQQLPSAVSMLIGGLSGAMGPIVNNPLDVVKTRLQKQNTAKNVHGTPKYTGLVQGCLRIAKEEGAGALWKGITPRLMRIVPGQAITFATYEAVCRWL